MNLTKEQQSIVESEAPISVVMAGAGTGKTSTLYSYSRARSRSRMLYIVFNKSVQLEAKEKFKGTLVRPVTAHGLAFPSHGAQYQHKLVANIKPYQVEKALNISGNLNSDYGYNGSYNNTMLIASVVLDTLIKYLYSANKEISSRHVHINSIRLETLFADWEKDQIHQLVVLYAKKLWEKMIDVSSIDIGMLHDGYLKLYQLSQPDLSFYSHILIDESQDQNMVFLAIVFGQLATLVFVGDDSQSIYGWRGAKSALGFAMTRGGVPFYLTGSFRFGPNIAYVANSILAIKNTAVPVKGLGGQDRIGMIADGENRTIICRTNAEVFAQTAKAITEENSWWHIGGSDSYRFDQILEVYYVWKNQKNLVRDPFLASFKDFAELQSYGEEIEDVEIKSRCKIVLDYGDLIPAIIDKIKTKVGMSKSINDAYVAISNAHRAKGLEFKNVQLTDDYLELCELPEFSKLTDEERFAKLEEISEELNTLYVAVTRAKKVIQLNFDLSMYLSKR